MKRFLALAISAVAVLALVGVAAAHWGEGRGRAWGPGMMGGRMGYGAPCPHPEGTAAQITEEKAKELAQQYADKYLAGFKVERVLPFTGMRHTRYTVELKNAQGEVRTLHINPFGAVIPFGGPFSRR